MGLRFVFDPQKSESNRKKHGLDFVAAQELWLGPTLEIQAKTEIEKRWVILGKIGESHWTAIITRRADWLRIISVRRSREEEKELYENRSQAHFGKGFGSKI